MMNGALSMLVAQEQVQDTTTSAPNILDTIWLLLICVAVIFAAYYTAKLVARKAGASARSQHMQVLDRLSISNDKQIMLIKVGEKVQMVGVSGHSINHIATLEDEDIPIAATEQPSRDVNAAGVVGDFAARLKASMPFGGKPEPAGANPPKKTREPKENNADTEQPEIIRGGLDSLDDMVSKRKKRFEKAATQEDAEA